MVKKACLDTAGPWADEMDHDVIEGTVIYPWLNVFNCGDEPCRIKDVILKGGGIIASYATEEEIEPGEVCPDLYLTPSFTMPSAGSRVVLVFKGYHYGAGDWHLNVSTWVGLISVAKPSGSGFFKDIGDYFISLSSFPLIGSVFETIGNGFITADSWYQDVVSAIDSILDWTGISALIEDTYDIVTHTWSDVTGAISNAIDGLSDIVDHTWQDVLDAIDAAAAVLPDWFPTSLEDLKTLITDTISDTFSIVTESVDSIVSAATTTILGTYSTIDLWLDAQKDKVKGWIDEWFPYDISDAQSLLQWIGIEAGDVITTILDTPADMFNWIKGEIEDAYDILKMGWDTITFSILDRLTTEYANLSLTWYLFQGHVKNAVSDVWEGFGKTAEEFASWITPYITGLIDYLPTTFEDYKDKTIGWMADWFESILDILFKEEE